jgi:N utilization substance protein B
MHSPKARHKARGFAIQALYQSHFNKGDVLELIAEFQTRNDYHTYVDWDLFKDLLHYAQQHQAALDEAIVTTAARPLKEITPMELAILRAGAAELQARIDVPFPVVLSEYVDLAEEFGGTEGHQFVNAVLARLAPLYRPLEYGSAT